MIPDPTDRPTILIADDGADIIELLVELLSPSYEIVFATSGRQALKLMTAHPQLILLDINMPDIDGFTVCRELKSREETRDTPVIFLTNSADKENIVKGFTLGAVDYVTKPFIPEELQARVATHLQLQQAKAEIELKYAELAESRQVVQRQKEELAEWNSSLKNRLLQQTALVRIKAEETRHCVLISQSPTDSYLLMLTRMLEIRHSAMVKHSRIVAKIAASMADTLNLPEEVRKNLEIAALLHDIGLVCTSDRIAMFHGALAVDDYDDFRNHPVIGQELMNYCVGLNEVGIIIRHHHETFEGTGYPDKLSGSRIPWESQIIHIADHIADLFATMSGENMKYRITSKLAMLSGTLFDPGLSLAADHAIRDFALES